jgi:hypothetical protein
MAQKTAKIGETQSLTVRNKTLDGFNIIAKYTNPGNTAIPTTDEVSLRGISVKMTLNRNRKPITLVNTTADVLFLISEYFSARKIDYVYQGSAQLPMYIVGGNYGAFLINFEFLGKVINLSGDDEVVIEVTVNSSTFTSNCDQNLSIVQFSESEGVGLEYETPRLEVQSIQQGQSNLRLSLGENVDNVYFLNTDNTLRGTLESQAVISSLTFQSNKLNFTKTYIELLCERENDLNAESSRFQNFQICKGEDFDNVELDVLLNPSNVAVNKNYVATIRTYQSSRLVELAESRNQLHQMKKAEKLGMRINAEAVKKANYLKSKAVKFAK